MSDSKSAHRDSAKDQNNPLRQDNGRVLFFSRRSTFRKHAWHVCSRDTWTKPQSEVRCARHENQFEVQVGQPDDSYFVMFCKSTQSQRVMRTTK